MRNSNRDLPGFTLPFLGAVFGGIALLLSLVIWTFGSSNPETPAGYVGYCTRGAVFGTTEFVGLQTGPTSYGKSWQMECLNVSVTPTKLTESFGQGSEVMSKDNLKLTFAVHTLFRVKPDQVRVLVEKYSTLKEKGDLTEVAFENFIREPLKTAARQEVERLNAMEVTQNLTEMSAKLTKWAQDYTKGTPFEVMSVVVGNVQFPSVVSDAQAVKLKAQTDIQTLKAEVEQERLKAEKRTIEAEGMAKAANIIQQKLTALYVQHESIEAMKLMANGQNHTVVYIPVGKGGVPLVSTVEGAVQ